MDTTGGLVGKTTEGSGPQGSKTITVLRHKLMRSDRAEDRWIPIKIFEIRIAAR